MKKLAKQFFWSDPRGRKSLYTRIVLVLFVLSCYFPFTQAANQTFVLGGSAYDHADGGPLGDAAETDRYSSGRSVYFSRTSVLAPANVVINWNYDHSGSNSGDNALYCTSSAEGTGNPLSIESGLVSAGSYGGVDIFKTGTPGLYFSLTLRSFGSATGTKGTPASINIKDGIMHNILVMTNNNRRCPDSTAENTPNYDTVGGLGFYSAITFYTDQTYTPGASTINLLQKNNFHVRIWNENPGAAVRSYSLNVTYDISTVTVSEPTCITQPSASGNSVNGTAVDLGRYSPKDIINGAKTVPFSINISNCRGLRNINVTLTSTTLGKDKTLLGNNLLMDAASGVGVAIHGMVNNYNPQMLLIPNEATSVYNDQRNTSGDVNIYGDKETGKAQNQTLNFQATLKQDSGQHITSGNFKANGTFTLDYP